MKIKTLTRPLSSVAPAGSDGVNKLPRNLSAPAHPLERGREYVRALNAVKLERLFAAPFLAEIGRHVDGVYTLQVDPKSLERVASGSGDGMVKVFDLPGKSEIWSSRAHENIVKGMAWTLDQKLLTCAADRSIKLWDPYNTASDSEPISSWLGDHSFTSISHHRSKNSFAVASNIIRVYDLEQHSAAPEILRWPTTVDTISAVKFNPIETSVLASAGMDRSLVLYDLRTQMPLCKTTFTFAVNAISWNPMEAFVFAVASENHDINIFDMRKLDRSLNCLKGHVAAVMDVEFSPTGQELASAGWDRTLRLWRTNEGHSYDIYHTKRMQRVFSVKWTPDNKYLLSGSDDGNVRLWRAKASERQGVKTTKQRQALEYNEALIKRYAHMPEIRRIKRHRHLPKVVKKAGSIKSEELKAIKRREENERKHSKLKFEKRKSEREKMILAKEQ